MLERKGIDHEIKELFPGGHPTQLRLAGFRRGTVPGLIDGRRVQGSLNISRALDELRPEPRLFPADPEQRRAVEEAEAWGESEFQPVPRRMFRWGMSRLQPMRVTRISAGWSRDARQGTSRCACCRSIRGRSPRSCPKSGWPRSASRGSRRAAGGH